MFTKRNKGGSKPDKSKPPQAPSPKVAPPTIISKDLRIVGDIQSDGEIQVDGSIEGDIRAHILLIGETANITGEVISDSVIVHGMVKGHIKSRSVKLARTANVIGDILHEDLAIETGASMEGHCKRVQGQIAPKIEFQTEPIKSPKENSIRPVIAQGPETAKA